jgi:alkyl hydroperoxide reductase subunit AhpC
MQENSGSGSNHDSGVSMQALEEIVRLKTIIEELQQSKSLIAQELTGCKAQLQDKKDEIFKLTCASNKCTRELQKRQDEKEELRRTSAREVADLTSRLDRANKLLKAREEDSQKAKISEISKKEVLDLEAKLDRAIKLQKKQEEDHQDVIADYDGELAAKNLEIYNIERELTQVKQQVEDLQSEIETSRATTCASPTHPSTIVPATETPPQFYQHIKDLEEKVRRLSKGHERGCDDYAKQLAREVEDIRDLQRAAEADVEGLQHLDKANVELEAQLASVHKTLVGIVAENTQKEKFQSELVRQIADLSIKLGEKKDQISKLDAANRIPKQPVDLRISAVTCQVQTSPVLATKRQSIGLDLSGVTCQAEISPVPVSKRAPPLTMSTIECQSTSPCTPPPSTDPKFGPGFLAALNDLGAGINNLPTFQNPKPKPTATRPNVAVKINIKPSERRNWSLLTHIGLAISKTSTLDIDAHDEKVLKEFVDSIEWVSTEHEERGRAAKQWEKEAQLRRKEVEN